MFLNNSRPNVAMYTFIHCPVYPKRIIASRPCSTGQAQYLSFLSLMAMNSVVSAPLRHSLTTFRLRSSKCSLSFFAHSALWVFQGEVTAHAYRCDDYDGNDDIYDNDNSDDNDDDNVGYVYMLLETTRFPSQMIMIVMMTLMIVMSSI